MYTHHLYRPTTRHHPHSFPALEVRENVLEHLDRGRVDVVYAVHIQHDHSDGVAGDLARHDVS